MRNRRGISARQRRSSNKKVVDVGSCVSARMPSFRCLGRIDEPGMTRWRTLPFFTLGETRAPSPFHPIASTEPLQNGRRHACGDQRATAVRAPRLTCDCCAVPLPVVGASTVPQMEGLSEETTNALKGLPEAAQKELIAKLTVEKKEADLHAAFKAFDSSGGTARNLP